MDIRIALEWDVRCGLSLSNMYPLREQIEEAFKEKHYGDSITKIDIIMTCMETTGVQRKRYKKGNQEFYFDIILDFFLIMNKAMDQKKDIIRNQICKIANQTFDKYNFENFDKSTFLLDFENQLKSIEW